MWHPPSRLSALHLHLTCHISSYLRMPKGIMSKTIDAGGDNHWFRCKCDYQWQGATQRAKDLAFRLHQRNCANASNCSLKNETFAPSRMHLENNARKIDTSMAELKSRPRVEV